MKWLRFKRLFARSALLCLFVIAACAHRQGVNPPLEGVKDVGANALPVSESGVDPKSIPAGSRFAVAETPELRATHEAHSLQFMVTTSGPLSSLAAREIFAKGGNLVDAAVAASFALAVERPHSTGLGGGGFLLYRTARKRRVMALDFRETAPAKARPDMYLGPDGHPVVESSLNGPLAAGVPGFVAGLCAVHQQEGKLPLKTILQPAIRLAEQGFLVYPSLAKALLERQEVLARFPASRKIFLNPAGVPWKEGDRLIQKDLAKTLRIIARRGARGFYQGAVARAIVKKSQSQGGLISKQDLQSYEVKWRQPVQGNFRGYQISSMPPPSSGGVHVLEILNVLSALGIDDRDAWTASNVHKTATAMQWAFADRAKYMGDPDFGAIPTKGLISPAYALALSKGFDPQQALRADQVKAGDPLPYESTETTHLTIADGRGNVLSSTQTINGYMGSGFVVEGTGVLLNNEMDDFSVKTGAQNLFGAVGGEANAIAPAKRPLSSMSPTIIEKNGQLVLAVGAPGGTRILTCVALTALNYLAYKMPLYEAVSSLRFHHQWKPDELQVEKPGFEASLAAELRALGYQIKEVNPVCRVTAIAKEGAGLHGVADPRDVGAALGW